MASLYEATSSQKRSSMARIVSGSHSFTCTPLHLSDNGMNHVFAVPAEAGTYFTDPRGIEG